MIETNRILAQSAPAATTLTDAYKAPDGGAKLGQIVITNQDAGASTVRIAISKDGDAIAASHYLYYTLSIAIAETKVLTLNLTLNVNDVVRVYSSSGNVSFQLLEAA